MGRLCGDRRATAPASNKHFNDRCSGGNPQCSAWPIHLRLRSLRRAAKAPFSYSEQTMAAIYTVLVFIAVFGALNVFEFGRLD